MSSQGKYFIHIELSDWTDTASLNIHVLNLDCCSQVISQVRGASLCDPHTKKIILEKLLLGKGLIAHYFNSETAKKKVICFTLLIFSGI